MSRPDQIDPPRFTGCFAYLDTAIPPGLTVAAWRTQATGDRDSARADLAPQDRSPRVRGGAHHRRTR